MNLNEYKDKLSLELASEPQRQHKALAAVDSIASGIAELSGLGYRLAAVEEFGEHVAPKPQEFPKMLYNPGAVPKEVTVEDELAEADARKSGYRGLNEAALPPPPAPEAHGDPADEPEDLPE